MKTKTGYVELYVDELNALKTPNDVNQYLNELSQDYEIEDFTELKMFFVYNHKPELAVAVNKFKLNEKK